MMIWRQFTRWLSRRRGFRWLPIKAPPSALEIAKHQRAMFDELSGNVSLMSGDVRPEDKGD